MTHQLMKIFSIATMQGRCTQQLGRTLGSRWVNISSTVCGYVYMFLSFVFEHKLHWHSRSYINLNPVLLLGAVMFMRLP